MRPWHHVRIGLTAFVATGVLLATGGSAEANEPGRVSGNRTSTCRTGTGASPTSPQGGLTSRTGRPARRPLSFTPAFVLDGKRVTAFDPPGPVPPGEPGSVTQDVVDVNNRGQVVGGYKEDVADPDSAGFRGYLRDARGRVTCIDVPGAAGTTPFDLNDGGEIVGTYSETDSNTGRALDKRGFLRDAQGRYRTIHVPGARSTQAFGINNHREVVGEYVDGSGVYRGFRWRSGRFTTLDGPGDSGAAATDVNDRGQIVGVYVPEGRDETRGFLLSRGSYRTFDAPGGRYNFPFGLNDRGQIVVSTIMVTVFGAFVMEDAVFLKLAGIGLAAAVFVDATVVRMVLVPATMELLGDRNWWVPRWLDRLLPRLDVEGEPAIPVPEPFATDGSRAGGDRESVPAIDLPNGRSSHRQEHPLPRSQ
jgi:hypothetical protein